MFDILNETRRTRVLLEFLSSIDFKSVDPYKKLIPFTRLQGQSTLQVNMYLVLVHNFTFPEEIYIILFLASEQNSPVFLLGRFL